MASISRDRENGRVTIQFKGTDGKRRSLRLGEVSRDTANEVFRCVKALTVAQMTGDLDKKTADWLSHVNKDWPILYSRLAAVGLVQPRDRQKLGAFLDSYINGRRDVKDGTRTNFEISQARMLEFFRTDRDLASITKGNVEDFMVHLHQKYARATVGKTLKHARQFFRSAVNRGILTSNPFEAVKAPGQTNTARQFFVTPDMAEKVLAACPDNEWRLIFALSRYGGLRCPSEHLGLTWDGIKWDEGKFLVRSPKTEHYEGGGERWVPIFPELRPYLDKAWAQAGERAVHVIASYRNDNANLRTRMLRIIRNAGLKPWPRLFHNLRATRQTELFRMYPHKFMDVCEWLGNSAKIAFDHYVQATKDGFREASAVQNPVQHRAILSDLERSDDGGNEAQVASISEYDVVGCSVQDGRMTPTGFEPVSRP